ncbi:hypothetical protein ABT008_21245 [Micromonospora sp. NPDC002389]
MSAALLHIGGQQRGATAVALVASALVGGVTCVAWSLGLIPVA